MAGLAIVAIVGVAALLLVPKLGIFKGSKDKERDIEREENRERKGAFGNTYDFFFGEGRYDALFAGDPKSGGGTQKPTGSDGTPQGAARRGKGRGRIA